MTMASKTLLKSILMVLTFIVFSSSVQASHSAGGSVSAEYLGQDQYKITATVHWYIPTMTGSYGLVVSVCGSGSVIMTMDSVRTLNGVCGAATYEFTHSAVITLLTVPVSGCEIEVYTASNVCCMENSNTISTGMALAYYMRIFPGSKLNGVGSSPNFTVPFIKYYVQSPSMKYCLNAYDTDAYDSLYYELDEPFGNYETYRTGFSISHPFGDTLTTVLNPNTGVLTSQSPNLNIW